MALTNAEKQARYRTRLASNLEVRIQRRIAEAVGGAAREAGSDVRDQEIARLQAENDQLRAMLQAGEHDHYDTIKGLRRQIGRLERQLRIPLVDSAAETEAHVAAMGRRIPVGDQQSRVLLEEILNDIRVHAPAKIHQVHRAVERKIAKLAARIPSKSEARRVKIAALAADPGATDGERAAAAAKLKRLA